MYDANWKAYSVDLQKELRSITKQYLERIYPQALEFGENHQLTKATEATNGVELLYSRWQITYKEYVISDKKIDVIIEYGLDSLSRSIIQQVSELIDQRVEKEDSIGRLCICYSIPLTAFESEKDDPLKLTIIAQAEVGITWVI